VTKNSYCRKGLKDDERIELFIIRKSEQTQETARDKNLHRAESNDEKLVSLGVPVSIQIN
jgi:hypothetical protein